MGVDEGTDMGMEKMVQMCDKWQGKARLKLKRGFR